MRVYAGTRERGSGMGDEEGIPVREGDKVCICVLLTTSWSHNGKGGVQKSYIGLSNSALISPDKQQSAHAFDS